MPPPTPFREEHTRADQLASTESERTPHYRLVVALTVLGAAWLFVCTGAIRVGNTDDPVQLARMGVRNLSLAARAWKAAYGDFPNSLDDLVNPSPDGKPPVLEASALIDPWGRPYVYDPSQGHPKSDLPLIYSQGADPDNTAGHIRNR